MSGTAGILETSKTHVRYQTLLAKGVEQLGHMHASDNGYQVTKDVARLRVLLVDDTFTIGARVQSAASALQNAGAHVVAAVVAGRVIDPRPAYPWTQELWDRQDAKPSALIDAACATPSNDVE